MPIITIIIDPINTWKLLWLLTNFYSIHQSTFPKRIHVLRFAIYQLISCFKLNVSSWSWPRPYHRSRPRHSFCCRSWYISWCRHCFLLKMLRHNLFSLSTLTWTFRWFLWFFIYLVKAKKIVCVCIIICMSGNVLKELSLKNCLDTDFSHLSNRFKVS